MSLPPRPVPAHVPTLTEVIEFDAPLVPGAAPPEASAAEAGQGGDGGDAPPKGDLDPGEGLPAAPLPATSALPAMQPTQPAPGSVPGGAPLFVPAPAMSGALDEAQIAQRLLADVQRQIDGMLEYRLREALAPILARASEALVRELRQELSRTMRDVVSRAVAQEAARQRTRS